MDSTGVATTGEVLPDGLVERDLIVRYFLDDAAPGEQPEFVTDGSGVPPALGLQTSYGTMTQPDQMAFVDGLHGRGLRWTQAGESGVVQTAIPGTKLVTLDGATEATLEVVYEAREVDSMSSRIVHFGDADEAGRLTLRTRNLSSLDLVLGDDELNARFLVDNIPRRWVVHVVFDSDRVDPDNRARLYVDGERMPLDPSVPVDITRGRSVELLADDLEVNFALGNRANGGRSFEGEMFYAAVYAAALRRVEVEHNAEILLDRDDP